MTDNTAAAGPALHAGPLTLSFDIGGTGLKAALLDVSGSLVGDRLRVETTYPLRPDELVTTLVALAAPIRGYDRVSAGFPGYVRAGRLLSSPHFITRSGPGSAVVPELVHAWDGFDLAGALDAALGKPTRVANDADLQGSAVITGQGVELVITLGTGFGSALFDNGILAPHLELAHHPFRGDKSYEDCLGEAARKALGKKRWNARVAESVDTLRALLFFDHLWIGGGNSKHVRLRLPEDVTLVDNIAGLRGGIALWATQKS